MDRIIERYLAGEAINRLAREYSIPYTTLWQRLVQIAPPKRAQGQHEAEEPIERFYKWLIPEPNSGCWLWLGQLDDHGYGRFWINGESTTAQRASWRFFGGQIPTDLEVDHICKNPTCVNPAHLRVVTKNENLAGRDLVRTVCQQGHPLTGDNLIFECSGKVRRCKICRQRSKPAKRERSRQREAAT